jgi:hypothetical protein
MILIAALAIWLVLVLFFVALCRAAASADGRDLPLNERYPSSVSPAEPHTHSPGLVLWEDRPAPVAAADLRARARGVQGRGGQYAAGS